MKDSGRIFDAMIISGFAVLIGLIALAVAVGLRAPANAQTPDESLGEIEIVATDLAFNPTSVEVPGPGTYTLSLVNDGAIEHDVTLTAQNVKVTAAAGASASAEVEVPAAGLDFFCSIPGHKEAGMQGRIVVVGSQPAVTTTMAEDSGHGGTPEVATIPPDPSAPPYVLRDPAAPARGEGEGVTLVPGGAPGGGDLIEVELPVVETDVVVSKDYVQAAWTFGGTVPGPVIRAQVGDLIRVHLVNPPESELSHSIDFHASLVAWNDEMRSIGPGEELVYEFEAQYAGIFMYHCGTPPALHHIANGMYGMIIVDPVGGLGQADSEFAFVQSEWYLGEQGKTADLTKAQAAAPSPDLVLFNGVASQYLDNPVQVGTGTRIRAFLLDAGPSVDSSFHVVGSIFDRVIKEGMELSVGNPGSWGSQAVDLAPAQGAVVEFSMAEDGLYPFVTHAFNLVGRGAIGLFQAGDGNPSN